jgi:hypothetical protein
MKNHAFQRLLRASPLQSRIARIIPHGMCGLLTAFDG